MRRNGQCSPPELSKSVTVRVAHEEQQQQLTEEQTHQAIGAAAQRVAALRQNNAPKSKDEL